MKRSRHRLWLICLSFTLVALSLLTQTQRQDFGYPATDFIWFGSPDSNGSRDIRSDNLASSVFEAPPSQNTKIIDVYPRPVAWLTSEDWVNWKKEAYSGMWWTHIDTFQKAEWIHFKELETASFKLFRTGGVRKTADWVDFSVTHLSVFWKHFTEDMDEQHKISAMQSIRSHLQNYTAGIQDPETRRIPNSPAPHTLAVLPFVYTTDESETKAVVEESLVATLASLQQIGIGRCIVAVPFVEQVQPVQDLVDQIPRTVSTASQIKVLAVKPDNVRKINMPKTALRGLQVAHRYVMRMHSPSNITVNSNSTVSSSGNEEEDSADEEVPDVEGWFGTDQSLDHWHYVYFTEPDLILHVRPSALPSFRKIMLEEGRVLSAHRFQPIPHASNFPWLDVEHPKILPHEFDRNSNTPLVLDPWNESQACCDQGKYYPSNPAQNYSLPLRNNRACPGPGRFWWACGFHNQTNATLHERHEFIRSYPFLYIRDGTGFPLLDLHQRVCRLQNTNCGGSNATVDYERIG